VDFLTSAWTIADSPNPRIKAQVISHVIDPVIDRACRMARIGLASYTLQAPNRNNTP
jgi:hypothetical protein